ncbi:LysR family transcriptional regulator [Nocardioides allogilvus]|uniref:LysR family transcriptional regulator n=1 Tax=Nocardioides allogilvus TaxID=2072017 RepID=UPI000D323ED4|nr:LysR family transcriptional regulator [Nocardioides allogilvus]
MGDNDGTAAPVLVVATVDTGIVSAGADRLYVPQSGLSRHLRQIDLELEITLSERPGGRLTVSRTGLPLRGTCWRAPGPLGEALRPPLRRQPVAEGTGACS